MVEHRAVDVLWLHSKQGCGSDRCHWHQLRVALSLCQRDSQSARVPFHCTPLRALR